MNAADVSDYEYLCAATNLSHKRYIASGAFGDVHEACPYPCYLLTPRCFATIPARCSLLLTQLTKPGVGSKSDSMYPFRDEVGR